MEQQLRICIRFYVHVLLCVQELEEQVGVLTKARDDVLESLKMMKQEQQSAFEELVGQLRAEKQELDNKLKEQVNTCTSL